MAVKVSQYQRPHPHHWWQPALNGMHWRMWVAEFAGTALLVLGGLSAVCLDFGPNSRVAVVIPSASARLLLTGLIFAGTGSLIAISPLGRMSGAHVNPAVTFAFWLTRHVSRDDLLGYIAAQCLGAVAGSVLLGVLWGPTAVAVGFGVTQPAAGIGPLGATLLEALMTAILVGAIFLMVGSPRTARWTPLVLWPLIAALVWVGAPLTGTSLNPARSLGPAVVAGNFSFFWIYVVGPVAGALVVVGLSGLPGHHRLHTAKLFHDTAYPSTMRSALPTSSVTPAPAMGATAG